MPPKAATTRRLSWSSRSASTPSSASGGLFDLELVEERSGFALLRIAGGKAAELFRDESGGHRWQRVPPNERRGRVHTSTVTVAVLPEPEASSVVVRDADVDVATCRGSGAGGQHRNKRDTAVILTHRATGLTVRCESERSQHQNRATAMALLRARLWQAQQERASGDRAGARRQQVGSGMRGDKRRTIRVQDDQVNDHLTGRSWRYQDYRRGLWG